MVFRSIGLLVSLMVSAPLWSKGDMVLIEISRAVENPGLT